jgi:TM2 domain-containing membrane protein YozV
MTTQTTQPEVKSRSIAYLLWGLGFVGICGLHRMYLGQYGLGTAMLFTFGLCGVGQLVDVAVIPQATKEVNIKNGVASRKQEISPPSEVAKEPYKSEVSLQPKADLDEWDLEQASIEETMKKLRDKS